MSLMKRAAIAAMAIAGAAVMAAAPAGAVDTVNDFTTFTRGDYIFGCMAVNGNNRLALERCACSIDVIASLVSHNDYIEAETVMSYRLKGGESTAPMFGAVMKEKVHKLKLAQIEGELKCF